ncbi:fibro-slime domain-containing protein [Fibrobacter sp. UWB11]|uniref:fibro-slime domain-containing protein n=1 Tax=Fibrobacter sp. UWB11 TaxID=1896202 RepID=UPI000925B759|nr:fibro-slime domain-containing protein [Fibrobacter sp. UWB11]SIO13777.1 fibro-slime domain-containing protein [Fibrobacter sp. UWB11]
MKFYRWITLGALFGCSVVGFAQTAAQDVRTLDIVIRDFQPNHPDFENFSEESVNHINEIYNYRTATGAAMNAFGYDAVWYGNSSLHNTCGNMNAFEKYGFGTQIGVDGLPMKANLSLPGYLQNTSLGPVLKYGECNQKTKDAVTGADVTLRGYENAKDDVSGYKCPAGNTNWSNPVIYTPGMVMPYLLFTKMDGEKLDMYDGVIIQRANLYCDNQFFEQWYVDVPGQNKRVNTTMDIPKDPNSKYYVYDYNYNNGGYSPLDSINPTTREWVMNKPCNASIQPNGVCDQFEPQTLSIFCPPYNYQYANNQADFLGNNTFELCKEWLNQGGPRATNSAGSGHSAAWQAAVMYDATHPGKLGMKHLRNYAFTMMGYASFKYKQSNQIPTPEVFEFAGDDDMWIFVDGVLVVDLGGTHLSAPGKVNIQTLAVNNHGCHAGEPLATYTNCLGASDATGWADDTWHHLHFFYADRQSDGSNIYIRTSLAELAPSRYGQPTVNDVVVKVDENGISHNSMYMNVPLADSSLVAINNPNVPSMVVLRNITVLGPDGTPLKTITGQDSVVTMVYGFYVTTMTGPIDKGAAGLMYQFEGVVKDLNGNVIDGGLLGDDRLAFNVPYSQGLNDDGNGGNYTAMEWTQLMAWSQKVNFYVAASSGKHVEGFDEREKWGKISYTAVAQTPVIPDDPAFDRPDFTAEAQTLTDIAGSGTLPTDMTADLVLTPIPAVSNSDPLKWAKDNAETLMISGPQGATALPVGSSVVYGAGQNENKTLCYNDGSANVPGKKSNETCTSWSFPTTQPFHVNIRVFDHLGHFVNQYNKRVTKEEFENALNGLRSSTQSAGLKMPGCGDTPMYGATGAMLATIKMYPVTDKGRLLATGPYVYQMTVVKDAYTYCYESNGNNPTTMTMPFQRTTETIRRGYRRTQKK